MAREALEPPPRDPAFFEHEWENADMKRIIQQWLQSFIFLVLHPT